MTRTSWALGMTLLACSLGCQTLGLSQLVRTQGEAPSAAEAQDGAGANDQSPEAPSAQSENIPRPERDDIASPQKLPETTPQERLDQLVEDLDPQQAGQPNEPLALERVVASTVEFFPPIRAAMREEQVAAGKQQSTRGAFDLKVVAESMNMPQGFYENYRQLAKVEQPTWKGGALYAQYRIGDGDFQPWYGERETNEGGEFKMGAIAPLLRGRAIDERRADVARADLQRAAVDPLIQLEIIDSVNYASRMYWSWVAAGQAYMVTRELLEVAQERNKAIARQVELGNLPQTELQQNERLIASREAKLIESQRKLQSAAIKLSLFWRDANGQPVVPSPAQLPNAFPPAEMPGVDSLPNDIQTALAQRPELRDLSLQRQAVQVDILQSENELLPNLSAVVEASKDVGARSSSKGDKTPFELEAGLVFDVPLQRNKALGRLQSASGKMSQLTLKQQYAVDKIAAELQDALNAMATAYERVERTKENVKLARELVAAEYRSFELGNSDVLRIALQEGAELDAQLLEIEALLDYHQARADYRAALGQDPLKP